MPRSNRISISIPNPDPEQINLLVAEDDDVLASMLKEYLESEGCKVQLADNGRTALQMIAENSPDLLVLDIMMPVKNGIDTLKELRASSTIPVIMLTARGDDLDRILGLELGADDYVSKPCNPRELYARIRAVLRRTIPNPESRVASLSAGDITLDSNSRTVEITDSSHSKTHEISLTQTEFDLLYLLLSSIGQIVSRSVISMQILGKPLSQWDRSIDMHVSNLRKKLGPFNDGSERIRTLRGVGYLYQDRNSR